MGISVGIVGVGGFGKGFVRLFHDHPQVSRVAVCDLDPKKLARVATKHGIDETYSALEEACRSDLDALAIFTQPWLHAPQAVEAMQAGKHVFSAVPVVMLPDGDEMLDWCDKVIETCRRTGMRYMMGETSYYRPQAMYCRRRAAEGAFGQFILAEGEYFHDFTHGLEEVMRKRWGKDFGPDKTGGPPMHYPTHSIGGLLSVMKARMTRVAAVGLAVTGDDWWRKDTIYGCPFADETAFFQVSNGAVARICEYRRIGHIGREGFQIFGADGSFIHHLGPGMWMAKGERVARLTVEEMRDPLPEEVMAAYSQGKDEDDNGPFGGHGGSHAYLVHDFVTAVIEGPHTAVRAWEAARYLGAGVTAHKSAMIDGEWQNVAIWCDPPKPGFLTAFGG